MYRNIKKSFGSLVILFIMAGLLACQKEISDEISLQVSPTTIEIGEQGGSHDVDVVSNLVWTVTDTSDWCEMSMYSGEGDGSVTVSIEPNTDSVRRETSIIFRADNISKTVKVIQEGYYLYDLPPDKTGMREITGQELALEMKVGWNVGNSLEAIGGETAWGNPLISEVLIDSVKAAGFNAIRIPVAWSKFSDESTFTIEESWMLRVEEVVNYVLDRDMYAIINIHWDEGWMQPTYAEEAYVNNRLAAMWKQIATHFRDYDDHLLFAGTNEVHVEGEYGNPTVENYTVQNGYNQTFITTVRFTGGRNIYRHLVIQGYNTNIDHTVNYAEIPEDVVEDRIMMEVHYYDPYDFTINEGSTKWQWGEIATDPSLTAGWGDEDWAVSQFQKMKLNFVDKGIPVILGEYGVIARIGTEGHEVYREYYNEYITQSLVNHGIVPFYWDNGYTGNNGLGIFDRSTGAQVYPDIVSAITSAVD